MSCPQQSPSLQTKIHSLGVPKHIVTNVQIGDLYKCQDALQYNGNLPYNGFRCQQKTNTKQGNSFTLVSRFVESLYQELKDKAAENRLPIHFAVDEFLRYYAAVFAVLSFDDFPLGNNNYYLYF